MDNLKMTDHDNEPLRTNTNPDSHKIAYFKDESLAKLLNTHCPEKKKLTVNVHRV